MNYRNQQENYPMTESDFARILKRTSPVECLQDLGYYVCLGKSDFIKIRKLLNELKDKNDNFIAIMKLICEVNSMPTVLIKCLYLFVDALDCYKNFDSKELLFAMIKCFVLYENDIKDRKDVVDKLLKELEKQTLVTQEWLAQVNANVNCPLANIPTIDDLKNVNNQLLINDSRNRDLATYIKTHFHLIKEEFLHPFHQCIKQLQENSNKIDADVNVYTSVDFDWFNSSIDKEVYWLKSVQFKDPDDKKSKTSLCFGSLLCFSCDNFVSNLVVGVLCNWDKNDGSIGVKIIEGELKELKGLTMIESKSFYECTRYILESLKIMSWWIDDFPFEPILLQNRNDLVTPPEYLKNKKADIKCIMKDKKSMTIHTNNWKEIDESYQKKLILNTNQYQAFKHVCNNNISLVQGPPGTGISFIGLKYLEFILDNLINKGGIGTKSL